jgi:nicotinamide-nucleotide amidase
VTKRAAVLVTGTEILIGRVQDRNSGYLARELERHGLVLERVVAVDDDEAAMRDALEGLLALGVDLVVTSGGLGPTHDDRTVAAVAAVTGRRLVLDEPTLAQIDAITGAFAASRGLDHELWREGNRKQATVPEGAAVLPPVGTAPGVVVERSGQHIVVLPGPPSELAAMWATVPGHPLLRDVFGGDAPGRHVLRVFGVPESSIANVFEELGGDAGGTETTICAARMEIEVLVRYGPQAAGAADRLLEGLRERLGSGVYAEDERRLEEHVIDGLRAAGCTLATAESCTAGLVAARVANVPGASDVLLGGIVAYANEVKLQALGVPDALLREHGAVSAECARAMADGVRRALQADVGVAITGIAGPGGGTPDKPVGLVYVCATVGDDVEATEHRFGDGGRDNIREWSVTSALHHVRRLLQRVPSRA